MLVNEYGHEETSVNTKTVFGFQLTGRMEDGGSDRGGAVLLYGKSTLN